MTVLLRFAPASSRAPNAFGARDPHCSAITEFLAFLYENRRRKRPLRRPSRSLGMTLARGASLFSFALFL